MQCDAVTTARSETRVPPHIRVQAYPEQARTRTIHGYENGFATFPPTIRAIGDPEKGFWNSIQGKIMNFQIE